MFSGTVGMRVSTAFSPTSLARSYGCKQSVTNFQSQTVSQGVVWAPASQQFCGDSSTISYARVSVLQPGGSGDTSVDTVETEPHLEALPQHVAGRLVIPGGSAAAEVKVMMDYHRRSQHSTIVGLAHRTSCELHPSDIVTPLCLQYRGLKLRHDVDAEFLSQFFPMMTTSPLPGSTINSMVNRTGPHGVSIVKWSGHNCVSISYSWPNDIITRACSTKACVNVVWVIPGCPCRVFTNSSDIAVRCYEQ